MINRLLAWADKRNLVSVRSAVIYASLWMTWTAILWATEFADKWLASGKSGSDVALVVGAVMVPLAAVQKYAFTDYIGSTK